MDIERLKHKSLLFIDFTGDENTNDVLNKSFKNVYYEKDCKNVVSKYFTNHSWEHDIDLVLFDVNKDNLQYLEKIRELNEEIPIFITSDDFSLLDTLLLTKQKIAYSFAKTINTDMFIKEAHNALIEVSKRKFDTYSKQIAIVTKTDSYGKIIYANKLFYETTGFSKEEVLGQSHSIIRDPHTPKALYEDLWNSIQSGQTWHGVIKNKSKDNKEFYVNSTIFPTLNSKKKILGYLSIAFIVTKDEQNKSKLKHYILSQKSAQLKNNQDLDHKVEEKVNEAVQNEKKKFDELKEITYVLEDGLNQTKGSKKKLAHRVQYLEDTLKQINEKDKNTTTQLKQLLKESRQTNYETHKKNEKLEKSHELLSKKFENAQESVKIFEEYIEDYRKKIDNLQDVISSNEKELTSLKTKAHLKI